MVFEKVAGKILTGISLTILIAACEQPAGDSEGGNTPPPEKKPGLISASISPVYLGATTSYLRAQLNCRSYAVVEFTYVSPLTPKSTKWKTCSGNVAIENLPVQQGTTQQLFQIKVMGYMEQPSTPIPLPYNLTYNFNPGGGATTLVAGKGITAGGGPLTGSGISIQNNSVGEVFVGSQTATGVITGTARNGLQGTIDP